MRPLEFLQFCFAAAVMALMVSSTIDRFTHPCHAQCHSERN